MSKIEVKGQDLVWGGKVLGGIGKLLLDPEESRKLGQAVKVGYNHRLPSNMDGVIGFGEGQVVGLEIKRSDLLSSVHSRMLARQVRTLRSLCDEAIVVILPGATTDCRVPGVKPPRDGVQEYLAAAQRLGVGVAWVVSDGLDDEVLQISAFAKEWCQGNAGKAVAGTDRRPSRDGGPGWFLRNIKGVGPTLAAKIHAQHGSTGRALLEAYTFGPETWTGAPKNVRKAFEEAMQ